MKSKIRLHNNTNTNKALHKSNKKTIIRGKWQGKDGQVILYCLWCKRERNGVLRYNMLIVAAPALSRVWLCVTPWTRLLCPWDSPGKNTGVGCHLLLQGVFMTQGSNLCLLRWQVNSLPLNHLGKTIISYYYKTSSNIRISSRNFCSRSPSPNTFLFGASTKVSKGKWQIT